MRYEITLNGKTYEVEVVDNRALVGAIQDAIEPVGPPFSPATPAVGQPRVVQVVNGTGVPRPGARRIVRAAAPQAGVGHPGAAPAGVPQNLTAPVPATPPAATSAVPKGEPLTAPMPGLIKDIRVKPGQAVKAGQVLAILEAMKMENEIVAPYQATVTGIAVSTGQTVSAGAPLLSLAKS